MEWSSAAARICFLLAEHRVVIPCLASNRTYLVSDVRGRGRRLRPPSQWLCCCFSVAGGGGGVRCRGRANSGEQGFGEAACESLPLQMRALRQSPAAVSGAGEDSCPTDLVGAAGPAVSFSSPGTAGSGMIGHVVSCCMFFRHILSSARGVRVSWPCSEPPTKSIHACLAPPCILPPNHRLP